VCNFVLMDVRDYDDALREIGRVLRPGGICVAVISHPAFACGPGSWYSPAPDSPRPEDRCAIMVDQYFRRGAYVGVWGNLDPVISFHRPLCDYWNSFRAAGFVVSGFDEPSLTERGRRELPPSQVANAQRIAYACVFGLLKPQR
jgi:SAM-dependent methyltransferase